MIVADNRAYDYSMQECQEYIEKPSKQQKQLPKKNIKKKPKHKVNIMNIVFVFALSILIISRYAYMAEINFNNEQLDKAISEAERESTDLNVQLMKSINLENLEKIAIEKFNMQYPDVLNQYIYVQVEKSEVAEAPSAEYYDLEGAQENKYLAGVKSVIGDMLKILD